MIYIQLSRFHAEMINGSIVIVKKRRLEFIYSRGEKWCRTYTVVPIGEGIKRGARWVWSGFVTGSHRLAIESEYRRWQRARVWRSV